MDAKNIMGDYISNRVAHTKGYKMKKYLIAFTMLTLSGFSNAGLITDYTLDAPSNIVTNSDSGLEWLQWTETVGKSIDWFNTDAEAQALRDAGWGLASNIQMAGLFNDFGFGGVVWDDDENTGHSVDTGTDGNIELATDIDIFFISLFGDTYVEIGFTYLDGILENPKQQARARFGHEDYNIINNVFNVAFVEDDWARIGRGGIGLEQEEGQSRIFATTPETQINTIGGIALVKLIDVPEPGTFAVMLLGLFGVAATRRRKR
jgi:hypothetical protein